MVQMSLDHAFLPTPKDYERWKGQQKRIFNLLRDQEWHSRQRLVEVSGSANLTARISELRSQGYGIQCAQLKEGHTTYRILEYVGTSTTNPNHCPTCRCNKY